jgi:hypothetical protein
LYRILSALKFKKKGERFFDNALGSLVSQSYMHALFRRYQWDIIHKVILDKEIPITDMFQNAENYINHEYTIQSQLEF